MSTAVERVQAKVSNWLPDRHALAVNGVAPCRCARPERAGEYVAGIRFKAWNPPSSLHPTIRPQTPLVFDVFDRWNGRSLGGMTYHVAHPGGRNYETLPGECERGRGAPPGAVRAERAHAVDVLAAVGDAESGLSVHAGFETAELR
jgi:uncharacterized protein (DUF2126 family)